MKKTYIAPAVEIVKTASTQVMCSSPQAHDEYSSRPSYSRGRGTASDDDFDDFDELW